MLKKYKIALITNIPTPYTIPLFEKLGRHPCVDLHVYFTARSEINRMWAVDLSDEINHKILPNLIPTCQGKKITSYHINPTIISELIREKYDAIIVGGYNSPTCLMVFFFCVMTNTPFILRCGSTIYEPSIFRRLGYPLIKLIVKYSDALSAYGSRSKEYLVSLGACPEKIFIASNIGHLDFFREQFLRYMNQKKELRKRLGFEKEKIILYVGQLIDRKGVKYLVKAYEKLRKERNDIGLVIVGYGQQRKELVNLCKQNRIEDVYFVGFIEIKQLPLYYCITDMFVLPSYQDSFPVVLAEAMACGLPVICPRSCGASVDLVTDGVNGYVIDANDAEELYEVMKKILSSPGLKKKMGKESERIVKERLAIDQTVQGFMDAVNYAIKRQG